MALCQCAERPRCQYHWCREPADWSIRTPPGRFIKALPHGRLHFMCTPCKDYYLEATSKPLKGIDRPEGADDEWRGSILDHLRHARIAIEFESRQEPMALPLNSVSAIWPDWRTRFTPAQLDQANTHLALIRKYRPDGKAQP